MNNNYLVIQELLHQRADYQSRLNLLTYDGSPELKEQGGNKCIYIRRCGNDFSLERRHY